MRRLPFLNGRLREEPSGYYHEILECFPQITPDDNHFTTYYREGLGHVLRVRYGEHHFKAETIHSICDGGGLTNFVCALVVRYLELLGLDFEAGEIVNCSDSLDIEEMEDVYERYADLQQAEIDSFDVKKSYHHDITKKCAPRVITQTFELDKIKALAKSYDTSITEYMMAHIFRAIAQEREIYGSKEPITALLPINCRKFFPSKTFRNLVSFAPIKMPETSDLHVMLQEIRHQFKGIDQNYAQKTINLLHKTRQDAKELPRTEKQKVWQQFLEQDYGACTTTFTNLGLVKLPDEILKHIEKMDFIVSLPEEMLSSFSCISLGNTLTFAVTLATEGDEIAKFTIDSLS